MMDRLNAPLTVRARMSWAFLVIAVVVFAGTMLWGLLNPTTHQLLDLATSTSDSAAANKGAHRVALAWKFWPLWFGLAVVLWGFKRAKQESDPGGRL